MNNVKKRGRPRNEPDTRTKQQILSDRAAYRRQRGINAIRHLDSLPDDARLRLPAVEAALSVGTVTVWRRVRAGALPAPHTDGRMKYYTAAEVRKMLAGGAQ